MSKPPRVFHLLQQANSALFRAVDGLLKEQEGIVSAHQVILFVLTLDDGLPSSDVAKRAGMSRSRLTGLLDTLAEKGLVRREQSLDDGRVQKVSITSAGADIIQRTAALTRSLNADLLGPFGEQERHTISAFLQHVSTTAELIRERRGDDQESGIKLCSERCCRWANNVLQRPFALRRANPLNGYFTPQPQICAMGEHAEPLHSARLTNEQRTGE